MSDNSTTETIMYFLFAGDNYYPCGGMADFVGTYATLELAREEARTGGEFGHGYDWYNIATLVDGTLVRLEGN